MNDNKERMILLAAIVETVCQHFCEASLAALIFQSLVGLGMSFFMLNIEGTYVAVPDEVVIYYLFLALQDGHDYAVQQLFPIVPQNDAPSTSNAPSTPNGATRPTDGILADVNWDDIFEPEVTLAPPPLPASAAASPVDLPITAALLGPQFKNRATTAILRHIMHQVRTKYSRASLARQVSNMFAQQVPLPFIDRALEVGMEQTLEEVTGARTAAHEEARTVALEAAATAAAEDDAHNTVATQEADNNTVVAPGTVAMVSFDDDNDDDGNDNISLGALSVDLAVDATLLEDLDVADWMDE